MMKAKMNTKNTLVSFLAIVTALFLVATVSASDIAEPYKTTVQVDDQVVFNSEYGLIPAEVSVIAGESVDIKVRFTALEFDSDVTINAEIEGGKVDVNAETSPFDVEQGYRYIKTLSIKVPSELKDELSDELELNIEIDGQDYKTEFDSIPLRVQRPSYDVAIKSVSTSQTVEAGKTLPVDIVLKNVGYNDLDDLYVTASIKSLGIEKSAYFGDVVAIECDEDSNAVDNYGIDINRKCNEDDADTATGRLVLEVPYNVKPGVYTVEVVVSNDDTTSTKVAQVVVNNDFENVVFKSGNSIWIVNPTDKVAGYRIVAESPASVSESIVFVPVGASKSVTVEPNTEGEYSFNVNVFTVTGELVGTVPFSGSAEKGESTETNPIVILTVVLAIIFIVLLIVLIVLIGKKPEKSGEFGESYY